jgi:polyhydroxyalkanoate synthesis regulator phasin
MGADRATIAAIVVRPMAMARRESAAQEEATVLNNRFAREALKQAATQVNQGVREGARQFVEREITPLRDRIDELEGRVARLERQVAELLRERDRMRP